VKNPSIIVVRKRTRGGHTGHHSGAWKVAYADFVTAMMAFFLVMWLVAQSNGVRAAVAGYFRDPGIFDHQKSNGPIAGGSFQLDAEPVPRLKQDQEGVVVLVKDQETLAKTAGRLRDLLSQMPEFKRLGEQIEIQMTPEGLRIELLEANEGTFFDTGSAVLKPDTVRILTTIARELGKLENDVVLDGHTDSRPYSTTEGYSNWELSADRANAARRVMEGRGLNATQLKGVRGYADTRLRFPDASLDPRNRRVSIIVQNLHVPLAPPEVATGTDSDRHPAPPGSRP
jgi:chemotaxis protein MotB